MSGLLFLSHPPTPSLAPSVLVLLSSPLARLSLPAVHAPCHSDSRHSPGMIPVTFSLSYWNLTSKVSLLRIEFCLVTNMTLCLYLVSCSPFLQLYSLFILEKWTTCFFTHTFFAQIFLLFSIFIVLPFTLNQWIFLSMAFCPLLSPLISPWLSHVLFQSTGAKARNEIWRPSLNGHAHILCNYLGLGSVSINLCSSLAPAAFWNPIQPTHRGETLTHDLSHRKGCWEWPVTLSWALSESAQSDPSKPHDLPSHSCAWSVLRGRKRTCQKEEFFWYKCVWVCMRLLM